MKEYQIKYEYNDRNGMFRRVQCCTVFTDYKKAENELSDQLSDLQRQGCTNVTGDVVEIGARQ